MERYQPYIEQTLEGEANYFNEKFPQVGGWLKVIVREAAPGSGEKGNSRRFEVAVLTKDNAPNAPSPEGELFVCFYDEGDSERRVRAEGLLAEIYPIYSKSARDGP